MTAVATCPQCQLQLSVPDEADATSRVKCPVCRTTFELRDVALSPVLELIIVPPAPVEPLVATSVDRAPVPQPVESLFVAPPPIASPAEPVSTLEESAPVDEYAVDDNPVDDNPVDEYPVDEYAADECDVEDQPAEAEYPEVSEAAADFSDATPLENPDPTEFDEGLPVSPPMVPPLLENPDWDESTDIATPAEEAIDPSELEAADDEHADDETDDQQTESLQLEAELPVDDEPFSSRATLVDIPVDESVDVEAGTEAAPDPEPTLLDELSDGPRWHDDLEHAADLTAADADVETDELDSVADEEPAIDELAEELVDEPDWIEASQHETVDEVAELPTEVAADESDTDDSDTDDSETDDSETDDSETDDSVVIADDVAEEDASAGELDAPPVEAHSWLPADDEPTADFSVAEDLVGEADTDIDEETSADPPFDEPPLQVAEMPLDESAPGETEFDDAEHEDAETDGPADDEPKLSETESRPIVDRPTSAQIPLPGMDLPKPPGGSWFNSWILALALIGLCGLGAAGYGAWKLLDGSDGPLMAGADPNAGEHDTPSIDPTNGAITGDTDSTPEQFANYNAPIDDTPIKTRAEFSPGFDAEIDMEPGQFRIGEDAAEMSQGGVVNPPSYSMDELAAALETAQLAEPSLSASELLSRAEGYQDLCDLAEKLTFVRDDPNYDNRTMLLLEAKDIFRRVLLKPNAQRDVAQLSSYWMGSPTRIEDGLNGVVVTGRLADVRFRGTVYEYHLDVGTGDQVTFVMPERLDRRIFPMGEPVVAAGSIVDDPTNAISGYDGPSPRTIWAAIVKPLDRPTDAPIDPRVSIFSHGE